MTTKASPQALMHFEPNQRADSLLDAFYERVRTMRDEFKGSREPDKRQATDRQATGNPRSHHSPAPKK